MVMASTVYFFKTNQTNRKHNIDVFSFIYTYGVQSKGCNVFLIEGISEINYYSI